MKENKKMCEKFNQAKEKQLQILEEALQQLRTVFFPHSATFFKPSKIAGFAVDK